MNENMIEILEKLNKCAISKSASINLQTIECQILLDYISFLEEMKEDLQCHVEDLESEIDCL